MLNYKFSIENDSRPWSFSLKTFVFFFCFSENIKPVNLNTTQGLNTLHHSHQVFAHWEMLFLSYMLFLEMNICVTIFYNNCSWTMLWDWFCGELVLFKWNWLHSEAKDDMLLDWIHIKSCGTFLFFLFLFCFCAFLSNVKQPHNNISNISKLFVFQCKQLWTILQYYLVARQ